MSGYFKYFGKCILAAAALLASVQAQAVTYDITQQLNGGQVATVATLEIVQSGDDARFTLTGSFDYLSDQTFIKEIFFSGDDGVFVAGSGNTILDAPMTAFFTDGIDNSGISFDWRVRFPTANSNDRFTAGDVATWTIEGASADSFINPMVKLNGATGGIVRVTALSPVPEASSWMMILAGFSLMAFRLRRRHD
jgi:hypothetical protein